MTNSDVVPEDVEHCCNHTRSSRDQLKNVFVQHAVIAVNQQDTLDIVSSGYVYKAPLVLDHIIPEYNNQISII